MKEKKSLIWTQFETKMYHKLIEVGPFIENTTLLNNLL